MKSQSTTKGFAVLSVATMMVKIFSILYVTLLIRIIGKEGYGVYSSTYIVFAFIYVITNSGISVAISKIISELISLKEYKNAIKTFKIARSFMLILGFCMFIFMFVLAEPLARMVHFPKSALALKVLSPTILLTSILSVYRGYFQGRGNMAPTAVSQVIEQVVNTIFSLIFAFWWLHYGLEEGIAGATVGTSLGALVALVYLIRIYEKNKVFKVKKEEIQHTYIRHSGRYLFKKLIKYALPITICLGFQNAGNLIDMTNVKSRLIVAGLNDSSASVLFGALNSFNVLVGVPIAIISALSAAILPSIATSVVLNQRKEVENKVNHALRLSLLVSVPCAFGLAVLSNPIYRILFQGQGYKLMLYGSVVVILWATVQIQTTILQSVGKLYTATFFMMVGITCKVVTNYILVGIPRINIMGVIIGNILCFLVPLILNDSYLKKTLRIKIKIYKNTLKTIISSILMSVVVEITYVLTYDLSKLILNQNIANIIATFICILLGAFVYLITMLLIRGISKEDLNSISSKILKFIPKFIINRV